MSRIAPIAPRFSSVIPVKQVYNENTQQLLDPQDRREFNLMRSTVRELDYMYSDAYPYGSLETPSHVPLERREALLDTGRKLKAHIFQRLGLLDSDFANDPQKRVSTIRVDANDYVLTGDDAQPMIDIMGLPHTTNDDLVDQLFVQEEARIRLHPAKSIRGVQLHARYTPTLWFKDERSMPKASISPPIVLTDLVAI